jgi:hypothetical protein
MFKRLFGWRARSDSDSGDLPLDELEREGEGEPRRGLQSEEYRTADPREVVVEGDVAMSCPGGAPQEGESVEDRRERDRS